MSGTGRQAKFLDHLDVRLKGDSFVLPAAKVLVQHLSMHSRPSHAKILIKIFCIYFVTSLPLWTFDPA